MKHRVMLIAALATLITLGAIGCSDKSVQPAQDPLVTGISEGQYDFDINSETGELVPLNGETIPEVESALYEHFIEESRLPIDIRNSQSQTSSATSNYWRYAIYRETCYALSRTRYFQNRWGQSTRTKSWGGGVWFIGDWNYSGDGVGLGENCKEFARDIVRRGTGNRYRLPSGYSYATGDIAWCRPGDIIQRPAPNQHTAIVFKILSRDGNGRATRIDVIDCNYVGGLGARIIARHVFPWGSWQLGYFKVW